MLTEKYAPKKISEFFDKKVYLEMQEWTKNGMKEILLLSGEKGTGKTALINAFANENNLEIINIDNENVAKLKDSCLNIGLFKKNLVVIDNFNEIKVKEILEFLKFLQKSKISHNPIILTAYDLQNYVVKKKITDVSKFCKHIEIKKPNYITISKILENICKNEKIDTKKEILDKIAKSANGDLRAAIIDLEAYSIINKKISEHESITNERDTANTIFNGIKTIFKAKNLNEAIEAYKTINEEPQLIELWIDENIPKEYSSIDEIEKSYYYLSMADIFYKRITSRQYWGYLRYIDLFLCGVSTAKHKPYYKFTMYSFPKFLIEMTKARAKREIEKAIGKKCSILHVSQKVAVKEYIPLFSTLFNKNLVNEKKMSEIYGFTDEEIEYLKGY